MAPANKRTAAAKASAKKIAPKTTKAAPVAKAAPKKSNKAAAVADKKKNKKKVPEPEPEPESEEEEEEEETIYEEVSDDSAIEDASASEEEDAIEGESADEQEEGEAFIKLQEDSDVSEDEVDEKALLAGIESSNEDTDYSDDEDKTASKPKAAKIELKGKKIAMPKIKVDTTKANQEPGVVYVGRIPHGFYEQEMKGYFGQFGEIVDLRLSRNPKTGNSRHYAFIRFKHLEVAKIVVQTMNNYLLFDRLLKCALIPKEKVPPTLFAHRVVKINRDTMLKVKMAVRNKARTPEKQELYEQKLIRNENKLRRKLAEAGIDYDFPGFKKIKDEQQKK
ncbi:nucleolar protein [Coemansia sp. RSA 2598]|nr:nucleolar protein [Coemansia sp. RSA 2598]